MTDRRNGLVRRRDLILGAAASALALATSEAAASKWIRLGSRVVRWGADYDVIHVGVNDGRFDHIMLEVTGNGIFIYDLDVIYSNGAFDHIPMGYHIRQGGRSRVINLRGGDRNMRKLKFTYRRPGDFDGPATVYLWGER